MENIMVVFGEFALATFQGALATAGVIGIFTFGEFVVATVAGTIEGE